MERSYLQVAAAAAPFNGGMDYRKETSPAVFDASRMPHPVVAPRGGRPTVSPITHDDGEPLAPGVDVPIVGVSTEVDWSGKFVRGSSRKHVPAPQEVRRDLPFDESRSRMRFQLFSVRVSLQSLSTGLSPRTERASHNELKHFERDIRFQSVDPDAAGQPLNVATYQVRNHICACNRAELYE